MAKVMRRVDHGIPSEGESDLWPVSFTPSVPVLVTCVGTDGKPNIIPVTGWAMLCRFPPKLGVALCRDYYTPNYFQRYSHRLISQSGEFIVNVPHSGLRDAITACGEVSGAEEGIDKFALSGLTPGKAMVVTPPIILECPVSIECQVTEVIPLGSHDLFVGKVVAAQTDRLIEEQVSQDLMTVIVELTDPSMTMKQGKKARLTWKTLPTLELL